MTTRLPAPVVYKALSLLFEQTAQLAYPEHG